MSVVNLKKEEFLRAIRQAEEFPAQASVCVAAYHAIQETDAPLRASLLSWLIETAKPIWAEKQSPQHDPAEKLSAEKLFELFNQPEELPIEEAVAPLQQLDSNRDTSVPDSAILSCDISTDEFSRCITKFSNLVIGAIDLHFNEEYGLEEFYTKLWETLDSLMSSCTDIERGISLQLVIADSRMPFQPVRRGMRMEQEEYRKTIDAIMPQLMKMAYVLNLPTSQRTEAASRVLWILDELKDEKEKTVFLSSLMSSLKATD